MSLGTRLNFNPHLRIGGDFNLHTICSLMHNFNPHLRIGGDTFALKVLIANIVISIHTSV